MPGKDSPTPPSQKCSGHNSQWDVWLAGSSFSAYKDADNNLYLLEWLLRLQERLCVTHVAQCQVCLWTALTMWKPRVTMVTAVWGHSYALPVCGWSRDIRAAAHGLEDLGVLQGTN